MSDLNLKKNNLKYLKFEDITSNLKLFKDNLEMIKFINLHQDIDAKK